MPFAVLNDAALIHERVIKVAAHVGTVLKSTVHKFDPIGVTAIDAVPISPTAAAKQSAPSRSQHRHIQCGCHRLKHCTT